MKSAVLSLVLMLIGMCAAAHAQGSPEKPAGTGVIVHGDGYVLTAHHVVANARRISVVTPGEFRAPAVLIASDQEHDLALLKVETVGLSEAPIGYAGAVSLDQEVIVAGFPFGLREISISHGRVSAVRTKGVKRVFQIDAAINPGNSGGPVFNREGEVVALVTTKFSHPSGIVPEGMSFAVPISYALPLLANIPDFDFAAIGKARVEAKSKSRKRKGHDGETVRTISRTTVRIDAIRGAEAPASATSPDGTSSSGRMGPTRPVPKTPPAISQDPGSNGKEDGEALIKVKEQLAAAQRQELQVLAERGTGPRDGMVLIPAGEFWMGTDSGLPDSRPMHRVTLSSYWLDRYEVTNRQYRRCVADGVCSPPKDRQPYEDPQQLDHPVTNVTWKQAHTYCQWREARLPTEAEWEKAARGTDGRRYPWGNSEEPITAKLKERPGTAGNGTMPVGSLSDTASPYGVYDLVGNVWEWVRDWYAEDYYRTMPSQDPQGPLRGTFRVLRGGDWTQGPLELRASYRAWDEMTYWGPSVGFRCAADVP